MSTPVRARILASTSIDVEEKYRAAISVTIDQHDPAYGDLTADERTAVLTGVIAAVRAALPDYETAATITTESVTTA